MNIPYLANVTKYPDDLIDIWENGNDGYPIHSSEVLAPFLKEADHYLVFASRGMLEARPSYWVVDTTQDILFCLCYETPRSPIACTSAGDALVLGDSIGPSATIVSLTDQEYADISAASFDEVEQFAGKKYNAAISATRKYKRRV